MLDDDDLIIIGDEAMSVADAERVDPKYFATSASDAVLNDDQRKDLLDNVQKLWDKMAHNMYGVSTRYSNLSVTRQDAPTVNDDEDQVVLMSEITHQNNDGDYEGRPETLSPAARDVQTAHVNTTYPDPSIIFGSMFSSIKKEIRKHILEIDYVKLFWFIFSPSLRLPLTSRPVLKLRDFCRRLDLLYGGTVVSIKSDIPRKVIRFLIKFNDYDDDTQKEAEKGMDENSTVDLVNLRSYTDDLLQMEVIWKVVDGDMTYLPQTIRMESDTINRYSVRLFNARFQWCHQNLDMMDI